MAPVEIVPSTGHSTSGVKYAFAEVAVSQTDQVLVAAVAGKRIRVHQTRRIVGGTATTSRMNSKGAGAGTAIEPTVTPAINGGHVDPFSPVGWMETNVGEALTINTGAGSVTGILIGYTLV